VAPGILSQTTDGAGTALAFDPPYNLLTATPALGSTVILYVTTAFLPSFSVSRLPRQFTVLKALDDVSAHADRTAMPLLVNSL
jgi:hypothetical protein